MHTILKTIILSAILVSLANGKKVNILYTSNINATYKDCGCGSNPLGGINRIKTFFDDFRSKNKNTIAVDGGNFFNSYPYPDLNKNALKSLEFLNYDLLSPGMHIFLEDKSIYENYSKKYHNQLVNSNSNLNLNARLDVDIKDIKIRFFSFIAPKLFKYSAQPNWLILNNEIKDLNYLDNGINVIIYCGFLEDAKKFIKKYNRFDLLLLSMDQQKGNWVFGKTTIVGIGSDAESVALVEINTDNAPKFEVNCVDLDQSIKSDSSIVRLFQYGKN